jgi:hypothetical protein
MRPANILLLSLFLGCVFSSTGRADIYVWTDDEGIKHFTNYAPPANAQLLMKTQEIPYDEQADQERRETEEQQRQALAWQAIAEKEAMLAEQQQEAEQRMAADRRRTEQILQQAEDLLDNAAAEDDVCDDSCLSYGYYPYYYLKYPYHHPWYYRRNGSIYYQKPRHLYKSRSRPVDRHIHSGKAYRLRPHLQTPRFRFNPKSGSSRSGFKTSSIVR